MCSERPGLGYTSRETTSREASVWGERRGFAPGARGFPKAPSKI
jgi:hypothetical protein